MDDELIREIVETGDKDKIIDIFIDGQNVLLAELDTIINKLKRVDKDFCIDFLRSHLEFINEALAFSIARLTKNIKIHSISPEQALLMASFSKILKDLEEIKSKDIVL